MNYTWEDLNLRTIIVIRGEWQKQDAGSICRSAAIDYKYL